MSTAAAAGRTSCPAAPPDTQDKTSRPPHKQTYLLQLQLSPAAGIGISVERCSDAVSNGGGIHCGQAVGPTVASNALRGTAISSRGEGQKPKGGLVVVVEGSGSRKNLGQAKIWLRCKGRQGPRNGGADVGTGGRWMAGRCCPCRVGSRRFTLCLPQALSAQPADSWQFAVCSGMGPGNVMITFTACCWHIIGTRNQGIAAASSLRSSN